MDSTGDDVVRELHTQEDTATAVDQEDTATEVDTEVDDELHIFVSHKVIDQTLADDVKARLEDYGGDRMNIFLCENIPAGEKWSENLHKELKRADWLIFIYTDPSQEWDWCLYETGFFAGKAPTHAPGRLICIHASKAKIPAPLKAWQTIPSTDKTKIKALLKRIYSEPPRAGVEPVRPDATKERASRWLSESAALISSSLKPAPIVDRYSNHLTLTLDEAQIQQFTEGEGKEIPGDATIDGDFDHNALELFDLKKGKFDWSVFHDTLKEHNQEVWVDDLCLRLSRILADKKIRRQSLPTFTAVHDLGFYCPVIHRSERVEGYSLKLLLLFLPTSTPPTKVVIHTHPYLRIVYGETGEIVEASPEAETLYGRSPLKGASIQDMVELLSSKMPATQKDAFLKEQRGLIGDLMAGFQQVTARVCLVFKEQADRAYLPIITRYFKRQGDKYIDVIYLDVSSIAQTDDAGVKICELN